MIATCPRCGQTSQTTREQRSNPCPSCGYANLVTSEAPPVLEAINEPLWGPALVVCIAVSLAVFVGALFAARAGAAPQVSAVPSTTIVQVASE